MLLRKAPLAAKTPLDWNIRRAYPLTPSPRRCAAPVVVRSREQRTPRAVGAEFPLLDSNLDVVLSTSRETQSLALVAVGAVGAALLFALGVATELGTKRGQVTSISPTKLATLLSHKNTLLVDIRNAAEIKATGSPSLKGFAARQKTLSYTKRDKKGEPQVVAKFGETFAKMKGVREDTIVVLLDEAGRQSAMAAREILNFNDFGAVYCVSGGAVALEAFGFAWKRRSDGLSLSLPNVQLKGLDLDGIAESYKKRPSLYNTGLAVSALGAAVVILFQEFDVVLEMVGIVGGANLIFKRFFFAEDREKSLNDLRSLFDEKIRVNEAGEDLKRLAATILEVPEDKGLEPEVSVPSTTETVEAKV